jgi:hypothetical protein
MAFLVNPDDVFTRRMKEMSELFRHLPRYALIIAALVLLLSPVSVFAQAASNADTRAPADLRDEKKSDPKAELLKVFREEADITNSLGAVFVWVKEGYRVGRCEVTQAEYEQLTGSNPSRFQDPRQPVEWVSWIEANDFCVKLTKEEQKKGSLPEEFYYTLPTEAQWDYFVDNATLEQAIVSYIGDRSNPFPVGSLPPNDYGIHDVRGNVWEWCSTPVARGGSYMSHGDYLMISFRYTATPETTLEDIGFRCILAEKK